MDVFTLDGKPASDKAQGGNAPGGASVSARAAVDLAGFTEHDRDMATSGLCGTFALALNSAFPSVRLALICLADGNGRPLFANDGDPLWRHAVGLEGDDILDVDGRVELADIVANYCWGHPAAEGGVLVEMEPGALRELLGKDRKSFDARYLSAWTDALKDAASRLQFEDGMEIGDLCVKPA